VFGELAKHVGDGHLMSLLVEFRSADWTQLVIPAAHFSRLKKLNEQILSNHDRWFQ